MKRMKYMKDVLAIQNVGRAFNTAAWNADKNIQSR